MVRSQGKILGRERTQKIQVESRISKLQEKGDSMNTYCSRLRKLWDELQNYLQLPVSDAAKIIIKEREDEQVYQLLMGLNDVYSTVRSSIIQEETLPKIKVYTRICKEEQHHQLSRGGGNGGNRRQDDRRSFHHRQNIADCWCL